MINIIFLNYFFCKSMYIYTIQPFSNSWQICEELMMRCLAPDCTMGGLGCDNMTVVLVCHLYGGRTYSELSAVCSLPPHLESSVNEFTDVEQT